MMTKYWMNFINYFYWIAGERYYRRYENSWSLCSNRVTLWSENFFIWTKNANKIRVLKFKTLVFTFPENIILLEKSILIFILYSNFIRFNKKEKCDTKRYRNDSPESVHSISKFCLFLKYFSVIDSNFATLLKAKADLLTNGICSSSAIKWENHFLMEISYGLPDCANMACEICDRENRVSE